ncbi:MAG: nitroreductase/quinone reductase family protein [Actinomycetota bacterium]
MAIFASYAGAPKHPAWFHNVVAHPDITVEIGAGAKTFRARVATGEERTLIRGQQRSDSPGDPGRRARPGLTRPLRPIPTAGREKSSTSWCWRPRGSCRRTRWPSA